MDIYSLDPRKWRVLFLFRRSPLVRRSDRIEVLAVALAVAVTATFTALCNVKDGNIVQAMAQDQANAVDAWAYYQAKGTKLNLAESMLDQLTLERDMNPALAAAAREKLEAKIAEYGQRVTTYEAEKAEIKVKAEGYQADYDRLNVHDDQFDLAEALMSVSMALLGITALTRKRSLLVVGLVMAAVTLASGPLYDRLGVDGFWAMIPIAIIGMVLIGLASRSAPEHPVRG